MIIENMNRLETIYMGGRSSATLQPIFKEDGTTLYVGWRNQIIGYNCKTGRKVQEFIGVKEEIIGFGTTYKNNQECLIACSKIGKVYIWNIATCDILIENQLPCTDLKSFRPIFDRTANKLQAVVVFNTTTEKSTVDNSEDKQIERLKVGIVNIAKTTLQVLPISMNKKQYYFDVGQIDGAGHYFMFAQGRYLYYVDLETKKKRGAFITRRHMIAAPKYYTALITPRTPQVTPNCIAGDSMGRITLYTDVRSVRPTHSTLHWHTLPVHALALSPSDTQLYSGGGEAVMVKWEGLSDGEQRGFVPRLGGVINWIGVTGDDSGVVGVDIEGEGVRITGADGEVCWVRRAISGGCNLDVGLVYDSRSKCVILNGISGCIQFFSPAERTLLYSMDVVRHNRLTHERNKTLTNVSVKHVAVNECGSWYATVEERIDTSAIYELRLKFWNFDAETQTFHLNTSIEYPHEKEITGVKFRPNRKNDKLNQCITISRDGLFKNWHLVEIMGVDGALSLTWRCAATAYYKPPFRALCLSFSEDGSVLALGYGPAITIWLPDTCQLKRSLTYDNNLTEDQKSFEFIESVAFGKERCDYLIVAATKQHLMVWNLLNYTLAMRIEMDIAALISDPSSCLMAVLKKDNTVYFFEPDQPEPITEFKIDEAKLIKHCTFVPSKVIGGNFESNSKIKSHFFYLNTKQEMYCLGSALKITEINEKPLQIEQSNFSRLLAEKLSSSVKKTENRKIIHENPSKTNELKRLLDTPNHTQLPPSLLACSFIHSFVLNEDTSSNETCADINISTNKIQYGPEEAVEVTAGPKSGMFINLSKLKIKDDNWVNIL